MTDPPALRPPVPVKPAALVAMPMLTTAWPSYQLGLLKPTLERAGIPAQAFSLFMYFGAHIGWRLNEALAAGYANMIGEWIWSPAAFGEFGNATEYVDAYAFTFQSICQDAGCTVEDILRVRREKTRSFLDFCLASIDWGRFGLVGFTVVMQQMTASLALAGRIRERFPALPILFGGAAFEEDIAAEILERCPQVDAILVGEGDTAFPEIARRLHRGEPLDGIPGLARREGGRILFPGRASEPVDLAAAPFPDYDEFFYALRESGCEGNGGPRPSMLPFESSRGCHWGARRQCIFCGLNRAGIRFRAREPGQVIEMLEHLWRRHGIRHFFALDNIMPPSFLDGLFGELDRLHSDLRLHYPVRPTLTRRQLALLKRGGMFSIQPGIESLSTRLLRILRKDTTAVRNLELIKWATCYGIQNVYFLMLRVPGEARADYDAQCALIARIPHFQPPSSEAVVRADRGSPMFTQPERFSVSDLAPLPCYAHIYPPDRFDLGRVAYFFGHRLAGALPEGEYAPFYRALDAWQAAWKRSPRPTLQYFKGAGCLRIEDRRTPAAATFEYSGLAARLYEFCGDARRPVEIAEAAGVGADQVEGILREFVARDLMVFLDGRYLSLALPAYPHSG